MQTHLPISKLLCRHGLRCRQSLQILTGPIHAGSTWFQEIFLFPDFHEKYCRHNGSHQSININVYSMGLWQNKKMALLSTKCMHIYAYFTIHISFWLFNPCLLTACTWLNTYILKTNNKFARWYVNMQLPVYLVLCQFTFNYCLKLLVMLFYCLLWKKCFLCPFLIQKCIFSWICNTFVPWQRTKTFPGSEVGTFFPRGSLWT